ncbi:hypothetical protein XENTR_v10008908 [Xenopus tropicalis]|uniref:Uncharacterized protein LOC100486876 isoform X2 n=1 Tax=Xenopus tropicalis TaxID=8364 RepID=A0A8J0QL45_XENTR|nr:uncharacterized protein LOC100486876 isoform X2 [Xenopus tropicalis]XP_004920196.2 uncharacterized protein LOC100486876 isoform X2 [Xenopus tropicalis]KAE8616865.1 hypothetical protein XENTR_v10008908 [Xenopus tropicalis]
MLGMLRCTMRSPASASRLPLHTGHFVQMCQSSSMIPDPKIIADAGSPPKAQASSEPFQSSNVKKYSHSVFLYTDPSVPRSCWPSRPLLLMLPWLGSKAHSYEKYIHLYFKLGFDVLVAESFVSHFLWPSKGLDYAGNLLNLLSAEKDLASRSLYVHAFSIGGYTFAQMLVSSISNHKKHREMLERIQGQVFDSLVVGSMERMATGVARMVALPAFQQIIVNGTLLYFSLLKAYTVDYYEKGIQTFWNSPVTCPALFFYCMDDPLSDHNVVEELLKDWEKQGIQVKAKRWNSSTHAGHLRKHPQEYTETLNTFIQSLHQNTPKCKL